MPATYDSIATTTLGGPAQTITLSSIPSGYTDLRIVANLANNQAAGNWYIRLNGDTGTNYSFTFLVGNAGNVFTGRSANDSAGIEIDDGFGGLTLGPKLITIDMFSYSGNTNKTSLITSNFDNNGSGSITQYVGLWRNTSAINSITFRNTSASTFAVGSTITLYGILRA